MKITTEEKRRNKPKLILFFTAGVGLDTWESVGNLERELALYREISSQLGGIKFVSYGDKKEASLSDKLEGIKILNTTWRSKSWKTAFFLLWKHYSQLADANVFKTNQIPGAEIPLLLKKILKKKLIVRCGYLPSYFIQKELEHSNKKDVMNSPALQRQHRPRPT